MLGDTFETENVLRDSEKVSYGIKSMVRYQELKKFYQERATHSFGLNGWLNFVAVGVRYLQQLFCHIDEKKP